MRTFLPLAALLVVLALGACGKNRSNIKPAQELTPITSSLQVQRLWSATVGHGSDKAGVRMQPVAEDGVVYVASVDGYLKALRLDNGRTIWQKSRPWRPEEDISYAGGPTVDNGLLLIGTLSGVVHALEAATGAPLWQARIGSAVLGGPTFVDDLILVRSQDGRLTALRRADGSRVWTYDQASVPALSLRGYSQVISSHGVVFFTTDAGNLVALRLDTGEPLWQRTIAQAQGRTEIERLTDADGTFVLDGTTLYVSAYHGQLTAIDGRDGEILWDQPFSSIVGLALEGTTLVGIDEESNVWAWRKEGGANLWKQAGLGWRWLGPPATQEGQAIVGDMAGYLHWLDLDDGGFSARVRASRSPILSRPLVLDNGQVVVLDAAGGITAWEVSRR